VLNPGDRIGDWEIILPLGQGGMGSVYRCRHALSHRIEAAVKVLEPTDLAGARERFIREAEALHALSHPAIVRVHGFGQDARTELLWLAMELVDGKNFEHLLQDGAFPSERATDIFASVAEGLAYAHSRGIVHRDIKPANLMLRHDGRVVLLDFGIAVQEGHDRLTQEGVVPGTVAYAAPEQVTFGDADDPALADIYSLGQVLCECLTGRFTFPRDADVDDQRRAVQILKKKLRMKPLDPGSGVPDHVRDLVVHATQPDPARRGPPLSEWAAVLGPERKATDDAAPSAAPTLPDLKAAPPGDGPSADDIDLDGPSVEVVPADASLPGPDDDPDVDPDLLEAETEVHGPRRGSPWLWLVGSVVVVVLLGLLVVLLVGGVAGGAAWLTLRDAPPPPSVDDSRLGDVLDVPDEPDEPGSADTDTDTLARVPAPDLDPPTEPTPSSPTHTAPASTTPSPSVRTSGTGDARLVVASDQPASIYLDGALLRMTPLTRRLDAGDYQVRLVAGGGREKRFAVHLEPGETARRIWDFDDGEWRSFEGGLDEARLPARPRVGGVESRIRELPSIRACLRTDPQPWTITLRFLVVPDGSVAADGIEPDSLKDSVLEDCLFDAVRALEFGPSQAGAAVRVRLPAEEG